MESQAWHAVIVQGVAAGMTCNMHNDYCQPKFLMRLAFTSQGVLRNRNPDCRYERKAACTGVCAVIDTSTKPYRDGLCTFSWTIAMTRNTASLCNCKPSTRAWQSVQFWLGTMLIKVLQGGMLPKSSPTCAQAAYPLYYGHGVPTIALAARRWSRSRLRAAQFT